jgi:hypothetical protein
MFGTAERRAGELKTCWIKPLHKSSVYGFSIVDLSPGGRGEEGVGLLWVRAEGKPLSFLLQIDKIGLGTTGVGSMILRHSHTSTTHWASPVDPHQFSLGQQRHS